MNPSEIQQNTTPLANEGQQDHHQQHQGSNEQPSYPFPNRNGHLKRQETDEQLPPPVKTTCRSKKWVWA
jgi:hypothetical protein